MQATHYWRNLGQCRHMAKAPAPSPASIAVEAFIRNARSAMPAVGFDKEAGLVNAAKKNASKSVSQKTINNTLAGRHDGKISTFDAIASALGIPLWVLFIPELKPEDLQSPNRERLVKLVENYLCSDADGRHHTEQMAAAFAAKNRR